MPLCTGFMKQLGIKVRKGNGCYMVRSPAGVEWVCWSLTSMKQTVQRFMGIATSEQ